MAKTFEIKIRVYYEDTDAGGIVYYANYLKYLERARTELIYSLGLKHKKLIEEYGFQIVVAHCDIAFKKPAYFEDHLVIKTELKSLSAVNRNGSKSLQSRLLDDHNRRRVVSGCKSNFGLR